MKKRDAARLLERRLKTIGLPPAGVEFEWERTLNALKRRGDIPQTVNWKVPGKLLSVAKGVADLERPS